MRTLSEVINQLSYHPATEDTAARHQAVRQVLIETADGLWDLIPDGPEKTTAMRHLQECGMYANLAIALTAAVDVDHPHVARVLPSELRDIDTPAGEPQPTNPDGSPVPTPDAVPDGPAEVTGDQAGGTGY